MPPINVLLSGLPTTLCLPVGDSSRPLVTATVCDAVIASTGLPRASFFLRQHGALLHPSDVISSPGQHTTFITVCLRRALPGGKGGFGAILRGSAASKKTTNFDACRDLEGRRLRHVRDEQAVRRFLREQKTIQTAEEGRVLKRKRELEAIENNETVKNVDVEQVGEEMDRIGRGVEDAVAQALGGMRRGKKQRKETDPIVADLNHCLSEGDWMVDTEQPDLGGSPIDEHVFIVPQEGNHTAPNG